MSDERISLENKSLARGYSNHIQRYIFAAHYSKDCRVLDAGCGTGYGSAYLSVQGATNVTAVDISHDALAEAKQLYKRDNLRFIKGDVERLCEITELDGRFDLVVNLENIEHLRQPARFLEGARQLLVDAGTLVVSTPNGALTAKDETGRILNPFHVQEFAEDGFRSLLRPYFSQIELFGQWKTPERIARIDFEHRLFETLCELYYAPSHRLWRIVRKLFGKPCAPAPEYSAEATSYPFDFSILPMVTSTFPWPPDVILAVCRK